MTAPTVQIRNESDFRAYLITAAEALEKALPARHVVLSRKRAIEVALIESRAVAFRDVSKLVESLEPKPEPYPQHVPGEEGKVIAVLHVPV